MSATSTAAEQHAPVKENEVPVPPLALKPIPLPEPRVKVAIKPIDLSNLGKVEAVESLSIRRMKGVGQVFTANTSLAVGFHGLVCKPKDAFDEKYQVLGGALLTDPRIAQFTRQIAFIPAFSWASFEFVLTPLSLTSFGARTLADLQKLQARFPYYKAFIEWSEAKRRHVVSTVQMLEPEREIIVKLKWPDLTEIQEAIQFVAFDNLEDLAQANDEVRTRLSAEAIE